MVVYIHGFNSSPLSFKAALVRKRMTELGRAREFVCPQLPHQPAQAIGLLETVLKDSAADDTTLMGSSLGGFYATWLSEHHGVRAVLVNPAVRPYDLLTSAVGQQTNLYTGEQYEFTEAHVAQLRGLEIDRITPGRYLLLVRTGDDVLDYRAAVERYRGSDQIVEPGGDHGFGDFDRYLDRALQFCGISSRDRGVA